MMRKIIRENTGQLLAGQDLVAAGYIALHGTEAIAAARQQELCTRFSRDLVKEWIEIGSRKVTCKPEDLSLLGATEWEAAGEGGILTALWNLSGAYEMGIEFHLRKLPLLQGTVEICEFYDLNPYRLHSEGCYILAAENGGDLAESLAQRGIPAVVIGKFTTGIKRLIYNNGAVSYLDRPTEDELGKII